MHKAASRLRAVHLVGHSHAYIPGMRGRYDSVNDIDHDVCEDRTILNLTLIQHSPTDQQHAGHKVPGTLVETGTGQVSSFGCALCRQGWMAHRVLVQRKCVHATGLGATAEDIY
jgi:hypothetical protein